MLRPNGLRKTSLEFLKEATNPGQVTTNSWGDCSQHRGLHRCVVSLPVQGAGDGVLQHLSSNYTRSGGASNTVPIGSVQILAKKFCLSFRSQFKVTLQGLDMSWYMHSAGNVNILLMEEEKNAFLAFPEQIIT